MKVSLKWIKDFVNFDATPGQLSDALTFAGLEVEAVEDQSRHLKNVVVGLIIEKTTHPQADRLTVCQVMTQPGVVHQIVCGAKNHAEGDRVAVALPGAILPGNFKIGTTVLRGVESAGMLCSEKEIGLKAESEGILILPKDAPLGEPIAEFLKLDDVIMDLKVTPNRADCLSHLGLAREIACLYEKPLQPAAMSLIQLSGSASPISVEVSQPEMCPLYCGIYLENVEWRITPDWMKKRLEGVGLSSISLIVDVTNYVLMELGQPLHAFDADMLEGKQIQVRNARVGEKMKTFDGTELTLREKMTVIADSKKPLALAGVIGSQNSGVTEQTKNIFLESAVFAPSGVRSSARAFGLQTDAAYRFSRGIDPSMTETALKRAVQLLQQNTKVGRVSAMVRVVAPSLENGTNEPISVSIASISSRLGLAISSSQLESILKRLNCPFEMIEDGVYRVTPPSYRMDLKEEVDFVEEVARLIGYEHLPQVFLPSTAFPSHSSAESVAIENIKNFFVARGMTETIHPVFTSKKSEYEWLKKNDWNQFFLQFSTAEVPLINPLSDEQALLRRTISLGLWKTRKTISV